MIKLLLLGILFCWACHQQTKQENPAIQFGDIYFDHEIFYESGGIAPKRWLPLSQSIIKERIKELPEYQLRRRILFCQDSLPKMFQKHSSILQNISLDSILKNQKLQTLDNATYLIYNFMQINGISRKGLTCNSELTEAKNRDYQYYLQLKEKMDKLYNFPFQKYANKKLKYFLNDFYLKPEKFIYKEYAQALSFRYPPSLWIVVYLKNPENIKKYEILAQDIEDFKKNESLTIENVEVIDFTTIIYPIEYFGLSNNEYMSIDIFKK